MMTDPVVGFAGLTHLGLVSAAATAARGFKVVGFDPETTRVAEISSGRLPVLEPGLDDLWRRHQTRIAVTAEIGALAACDVVYISSDVPTDDAGGSDLGAISALVARVIPVLKSTAVLVVLAQVPPGFTRTLALATERLFYQVETLVFGRAVERASRPERFIVGAADPQAPLPTAYGAVLGAFGCPILPMGYESAELAKIAINCCLVASVTVANTLAEISERIGADWAEIAPALKLDPRIGLDAYLTPGLGIAGGNLERDLATIRRLAEATGAESGLIQAVLANSAHRRDWALRTLQAEVLARRPGAVVAILGLAYKENTSSTKNSPSLALIRHLKPWRVRLYDPVVPAATAEHGQAQGCASALEAAAGADALVLMTPWPEFRTLDPAVLARRMAGRTIIDPYCLIDGYAAVRAGFDHFHLGAAAMRAAKG